MTDFLNPKKTKKKRKKKSKKPKVKKEDLVDKPVTLPSLILNDNAEEFYGIIDKIYKDADDSALAAAKFEADLISRFVDNDDEGQEVPDEFQRGFFQEIHRKLLELRALKDFTEAFKLGGYLDEIMTTRIKALFGGGSKVSVLGRGTGKTNFFGTDEEYLIHQAKEKLRGKKQ